MATSSPEADTDRQVERSTHRPIGRLAHLAQILETGGTPLPLVRLGGEVSEISSTHLRITGLSRHVRLGTCVEIECGADVGIGEVIVVREQVATIKLFSAAAPIGLGSRVWLREDISIRPSDAWLGRVINALGQPIDDRGPLPPGRCTVALDREPIAPLAMNRIREPCTTGVRAIDLFAPICKGQRIGIFAGSGVGKSTLIAMLTRASSFKTVIVALVAERGREVREFVEDVIQPSRARALVVVATDRRCAFDHATAVSGD